MSKFFALAAIALALVACQAPGPVEIETRERIESERQARLARLDSWDLRARAAVVFPGEAYNIGLRWRQGAQQFMILLEAPFGQGVFRIDADPGGDYRLRLPDGREILDSTPEALLEQVIGWSLPIGGMEYWIRGIPHPGSDARQQFDGEGRTSAISQDRWDIAYSDYFPDGPEPGLPRRIQMARDDLNVKLVIEHWQRPDLEQDASDLFPVFN